MEVLSNELLRDQKNSSIITIVEIIGISRVINRRKRKCRRRRRNFYIWQWSFCGTHIEKKS
jgi:hypothetical protein